PLNPRKDFVKRVIGLPEDEIEIKDKKVYVNGKLLTESYVMHEDLRERGFPRDEYGPVQVPDNSLFVLGDNRDTSDDSRYWGFVPAENIIARAFLVYWPPWHVKIIKRPVY
ncbi:MAG TPA: signal peptidase I, partial [Candidatus Aerophobetes bacterium]|nr:signal peptidase I [Candidatus Aerophobetes bacterium]